MNHVLIPAGQRGVRQSTGVYRVLDNVETSWWVRANVYQRTQSVPYAWVVPAAAKASDEQTIATVIDPRFSIERAVLIDSAASISPPPINALPEPMPTVVSFEEWRPGHMRLLLKPAPAKDAYLVISENYYKDWLAVVDGKPAPVFRGDGSLITVPVAAGAGAVELNFSSPDYRLGRTISLTSLLLVLVVLAGSPIARRITP